MRFWLSADSRRSTDHDLVLSGVEIELKYATVQPSGVLQFNQIRPQQRYDGVLLLAFFPKDIRGWYASKAVAVSHGHAQHCGEDMTLMLNFHPSQPPLGFEPRDGDLGRLVEILPPPERPQLDFPPAQPLHNTKSGV